MMVAAPQPREKDERTLSPWLALAVPACLALGLLGAPAAIVAIIDCKNNPSRRGLGLAYASLAIGAVVSTIMAALFFRVYHAAG